MRQIIGRLHVGDWFSTSEAEKVAGFLHPPLRIGYDPFLRGYIFIGRQNDFVIQPITAF